MQHGDQRVRHATNVSRGALMFVDGSQPVTRPGASPRPGVIDGDFELVETTFEQGFLPRLVAENVLAMNLAADLGNGVLQTSLLDERKLLAPSSLGENLNGILDEDRL